MVFAIHSHDSAMDLHVFPIPVPPPRSFLFQSPSILSTNYKTIVYTSCWCFFRFWVWILGVLNLEKAMAPHSSTLAWKIPWSEEPGRLQSMGSLRVGHDWATSLSFFTFTHWRRKWQPTPVFLPGESQGWGSLVGCHLQGCTELDMTEAT